MRSCRLHIVFVALFGCLLLTNPVHAQRRLMALEEIATSKDLPEGGLGNETFSEVMAEFEVTVDGKAKGCRTTYATQARLRDLTCRLITERARYVPAYDQKGRAIASRDMINVYWARAPLQTIVGLNDYGGAWPISGGETWRELPSMRRPPVNRGSAYVRFEITSLGRVGQCVVVSLRGDAIMGDHVCKSLQGWAKFKPPVDEKGQPFAVIGSAKLDWISKDDIPAPYRR